MDSVKNNRKNPEFDVYYRQLAPKLFGVAFRMLQNQSDALDVVQECFLRAFRSWEKFRSRSKVSTWLYRITMNLCYDQLRKRNRERRIENADSYQIKSDNFNGEWNLRQEKLVNQVKEEMEKLTPKQKTIFILRLYEELPYAEIARITRSRVGTVKATFFQTVLKLRKGLKEKGVIKNEM